MFAPEPAIADWRRRLAGRADLATDDLDELEDHLREAMADLQARGLDTEEAFLVAARRLGDADALGEALGGPDPRRRRGLRFRWLALGGALALAMLAFSALVASLTPFGTGTIDMAAPVFTSTRMVTLMQQLLVLAVGGLLVWRLLTGDHAARRIQEGGLAWVLRVLAVVVCGGTLAFFLVALVMRTMGMVQGGSGLLHAPAAMHLAFWLPVVALLIPPVLLLLLVWWLTGRRRRTR